MQERTNTETINTEIVTASGQTTGKTPLINAKDTERNKTGCLNADQIKKSLQYILSGIVIIGDPIAAGYFLKPCYTALIKHQKLDYHWDAQHIAILAAAVFATLLAMILSTKRGREFLKKYLTFIFVVSAIMGIAEGAPAAFFGDGTIKGLGGGTVLSTISLFVIFIAAGLLSYSLFKDSMDEGKIKFKGVKSRYKFVFTAIWYCIRGRREKIKNLTIIDIMPSEALTEDEIKKIKLAEGIKEIEQKNGELVEVEKKLKEEALKEFTKSLITVFATFLSFAAAVTCAALAANCLIGMWDGSPMIGLAVISFIAELIATTAIYNMYFAETITDAIYSDKDKKTNDSKNEKEENLTECQRFYRVFFTTIIKGFLFPILSIAVCFIATYIFYNQLALLDLPGIPSLSHNVILGILIPGMLVTGIFRIVSLKMAADWTYKFIIGGIDWLCGNKQNASDNDKETNLNNAQQFAKTKILNDDKTTIKTINTESSENKKTIKSNEPENKTQKDKPASKTSKKIVGAILAIINGASLGSGVTSPTKLFPKYLQSHESLCMALYIITGAALTIASIAANLNAWNAPPKKFVGTLKLFQNSEPSVDNASNLLTKEENFKNIIFV